MQNPRPIVRQFRFWFWNGPLANSVSVQPGLLQTIEDRSSGDPEVRDGLRDGHATLNGADNRWLDFVWQRLRHNETLVLMRWNNNMLKPIQGIRSSRGDVVQERCPQDNYDKPCKYWSNHKVPRHLRHDSDERNGTRRRVHRSGHLHQKNGPGNSRCHHPRLVSERPDQRSTDQRSDQIAANHVSWLRERTVRNTEDENRRGSHRGGDQGILLSTDRDASRTIPTMSGAT